MWLEQRGSTWRVRDRVGDRVVTIRSGIPTKTAAKNYMTNQKSDKLRGDSLIIGGGKLTLGEWIDDWWPSYKVSLKPSSLPSRDGIIRRYVRPMLGHMPLDDIDQATVQRWTADLLAGKTHVKHPRKLARKTVADAHGLLSTLMSEAVAQRLIRSNPCQRTRLPHQTHREMKFLNEPEAARLLAAVDEHYKVFVLTLLGTGMRFGEAIGLMVKDVDVLAQRVYVRRNLHWLSGEFVETSPKTESSRRTISITSDLASALIPLTVDRGPEDRLFVSHDGGPVRYRAVWHRWDGWRTEAGLPGLRIHDLRHTHAAWLISSHIRGGLTTVQRRLGHGSFRITSDIYGHLMPAVDEDVMGVMDAKLPKIEGGSNAGAIGPDSNVEERTSA